MPGIRGICCSYVPLSSLLNSCSSSSLVGSPLSCCAVDSSFMVFRTLCPLKAACILVAASSSLPPSSSESASPSLSSPLPASSSVAALSADLGTSARPENGHVSIWVYLYYELNRLQYMLIASRMLRTHVLRYSNYVGNFWWFSGI